MTDGEPRPGEVLICAEIDAVRLVEVLEVAVVDLPSSAVEGVPEQRRNRLTPAVLDQEGPRTAGYFKDLTPTV
jgi:hypothetical protein